jgi:hypothetical protein
VNEARQACVTAVNKAGVRRTPARRPPSPICAGKPGLPDGIMNVVDRDQEALYALLVNPDVKRSPS